MHAPHTTCPGCHEEVFLDELVGGKCPLCGCSLEEFEDSFGDFEGVIERSDLSWLIFNYFVFRQFADLGVAPQQIMDFINIYGENAEKPSDEMKQTAYSLEIRMKAFDRIRPKKCHTCGRWFIAGGRKKVEGDMRRPELAIRYTCDRC
jgi:hypothetical protein